MTDRLTDEEIAEIRGRAEAATEGPWDVAWGTYLITISREDAEFCIHARTDIPRLLDEVERLRALADCPACDGEGGSVDYFDECETCDGEGELPLQELEEVADE